MFNGSKQIKLSQVQEKSLKNIRNLIKPSNNVTYSNLIKRHKSRSQHNSQINNNMHTQQDYHQDHIIIQNIKTEQSKQSESSVNHLQGSNPFNRKQINFVNIKSELSNANQTKNINSKLNRILSNHMENQAINKTYAINTFNKNSIIDRQRINSHYLQSELSNDKYLIQQNKMNKSNYFSRQKQNISRNVKSEFSSDSFYNEPNKSNQIFRRKVMSSQFLQTDPIYANTQTPQQNDHKTNKNFFQRKISRTNQVKVENNYSSKSQPNNIHKIKVSESTLKRHNSSLDQTRQTTPTKTFQALNYQMIEDQQLNQFNYAQIRIQRSFSQKFKKNTITSFYNPQIGSQENFEDRLKLLSRRNFLINEASTQTIETSQKFFKQDFSKQHRLSDFSLEQQNKVNQSVLAFFEQGNIKKEKYSFSSISNDNNLQEKNSEKKSNASNFMDEQIAYHSIIIDEKLEIQKNAISDNIYDRNINNTKQITVKNQTQNIGLQNDQNIMYKEDQDDEINNSIECDQSIKQFNKRNNNNNINQGLNLNLNFENFDSFQQKQTPKQFLESEQNLKQIFDDNISKNEKHTQIVQKSQFGVKKDELNENQTIFSKNYQNQQQFEQQERKFIEQPSQISQNDEQYPTLNNSDTQLNQNSQTLQKSLIVQNKLIESNFHQVSNQESIYQVQKFSIQPNNNNTAYHMDQIDPLVKNQQNLSILNKQQQLNQSNILNLQNSQQFNQYQKIQTEEQQELNSKKVQNLELVSQNQSKIKDTENIQYIQSYQMDVKLEQSNIIQEQQNSTRSSQNINQSSMNKFNKESDSQSQIHLKNQFNYQILKDQNKLNSIEQDKYLLSKSLKQINLQKVSIQIKNYDIEEIEDIKYDSKYTQKIENSTVKQMDASTVKQSDLPTVNQFDESKDKQNKVSSMRQSDVSKEKQSDESTVKQNDTFTSKQSDISNLKQFDEFKVKKIDVPTIKLSDISTVQQYDISSMKQSDISKKESMVASPVKLIDIDQLYKVSIPNQDILNNKTLESPTSNAFRSYAARYKKYMKQQDIIGDIVQQCFTMMNGSQNVWSIPLFLVHKRYTQITDVLLEDISSGLNIWNLKMFDKFKFTDEYNKITDELEKKQIQNIQTLKKMCEVAIIQSKKLPIGQEAKLNSLMQCDLNTDIRELVFVYLYQQVLARVNQIYTQIQDKKDLRRQIEFINQIQPTELEWAHLTIGVQSTLILLETKLYSESVDFAFQEYMTSINEQNKNKLNSTIKSNDVKIKKLKIKYQDEYEI